MGTENSDGKDQSQEPVEEPTEERKGAIYAGFVADQLAEEQARKTSLEKGGITVITTAVAVAGLLFSVAEVVTGKELYQPSADAKSLLVGVAIAFGIAAAAALATNFPLVYRGLDPKDVVTKLTLEGKDFRTIDVAGKAAPGTPPTFSMADDNLTSREHVAATHCIQLRRFQTNNFIKASFLVVAMAAEAAAIVLLVLAARTLLS